MDEMKYAKIAYMMPFQSVEKALHEPALQLFVKENEPVNFGVSLFLLGLQPEVAYAVSCTVTHAEEMEDFPVFVISRRFAMENGTGINGRVPASFDLDIEIKEPLRSGQYKIEAKLKSENSKPDETKKSISFIEIEIITADKYGN